MTKAASYLLWSDAFSSVRDYLLGHMVFMISDSTGVPPAFAAKAGFVEETYGTFKGSLLRASVRHNRDFRKLWQGQPRRALPFRYGYLSGHEPHLLVAKKSAPPAPPAPVDQRKRRTKLRRVCLAGSPSPISASIRSTAKPSASRTSRRARTYSRITKPSISGWNCTP